LIDIFWILAITELSGDCNIRRVIVDGLRPFNDVEKGLSEQFEEIAVKTIYVDACK